MGGRFGVKMFPRRYIEFGSRFGNRPSEWVCFFCNKKHITWQTLAVHHRGKSDKTVVPSHISCHRREDVGKKGIKYLLAWWKSHPLSRSTRFSRSMRKAYSKALTKRWREWKKLHTGRLA